MGASKLPKAPSSETLRTFAERRRAELSQRKASS